MGESFWRGHVRLGVASTLTCSATGIVYASSTWSQPHRAIVLAIGVFAVVTCPLMLSPLVTRALTGPHRERFLYVWSASLLLSVAASVVLDGGGRSPLTLLFTASLVFTASGFGRTGAMLMGAATSGLYLATCLVASPGAWTVGFTVMALAILAATCTLTAGRLRLLLESQEELTEQLRWQASHDGLTGCRNHAAFVQDVEEAVVRAHRARRPLGLLMLDLDDFKRANDTFGHVVADELLASLGNALRSSVREGDVVGRVGGDEFAVLVAGADEAETAVLADRIRAEMLAVGAAMAVGVSIGRAALHAGDDGRELRQRADRSLYEAKRKTVRLP